MRVCSIVLTNNMRVNINGSSKCSERQRLTQPQ